MDVSILCIHSDNIWKPGICLSSKQKIGKILNVKSGTGSQQPEYFVFCLLIISMT